MKKMSKLIVMVLAVVMLLSMAATVSAATITIANLQKNFIEEVYKVADFKADDAGNKWYNVPSTSPWYPIMNQIFKLDAQGYILGYNQGYSDTTFAATLIDWLKDETDGDDQKTNYERVAGTKVADLTNVDAGYYVLVTKERAENGDEAFVSNVGAAFLDDKTDSLTIKQKNIPTDLPKISKIMNGLPKDYTVGDIAYFKIEVLCEEGKSSYKIHDQMSGMTLNQDSFSITCDVPGCKVEKVFTCGDGCTFEIIVSFPENVTSKAYDKITINYNATVTEDGFAGVSNKTWIDGQTTPDNPQVSEDPTSYKLKKVDQSNKQLNGAIFELYVAEGESKVLVPLVLVNGYYRPKNAKDTADAVTITAGDVTIKGLDPDKTYYVLETQAPAGYVPVDGYVQLLATTEIINVKADELPETGGIGTTLFYVFGGVMFLGAAVLLVTKKRMAA